MRLLRSVAALLLCAPLLLLLGLQVTVASDCRLAHDGPAGWTISNDIISRSVSVVGKWPKQVRLVLRDGIRELRAESDGFLLRLDGGRELTAADFVWDEPPERLSVDHGLSVSFEGRARSLPLRARLIFMVLPGRHYMWKQLALSAMEQTPLVLRDVQVERMAVVGGTTDLGGLGQPVFINDRWFCGLEYPAADNTQKDGIVTLEHHPGVSLVSASGWWRSKPAVFGALPEAEAEIAFRKYLGAIRRPPRSYVVYNSWYDLRRGEMTAETLIDRARKIHEELTVKRGAPFDAIVLDDGWQKRQSIWEIETGNFPEGFGPLMDAVRPMSVSLGLWHPLTAVHGNLDVAWGAANGFEVSPNKRFFCLSGPKYNRALREELRKHTTEYDIAYFKHDFNTFSCSAVGHGHLPDPIYGREANVDAEIELFGLLTRLNPHVYLNPSGGMWLSPWWLKYVDTVWMRHCGDFGYNKQVIAYEPRDWAVTYRDTAIYSNLHGDRSQFPMSAIMTIGVIDGRLNRLGGKSEPLDRWANNVVMNVGRGSMLKELYITPELLSDQQWDILASALKWQQQYVGQMAEGRMLPIDPRWPDVYGYVHLDENGGFLCLRNAGIISRHTSVALPELDAGTSYVASRIYPWHEGLALERMDGGLGLATEVEPYGATVIEIRRSDRLPEPVISGARASLVECEPGEIIYDVWGHPGSEATITIHSPTPVRSVQVENRAVVTSSGSIVAVPLQFPGTAYHLWQIEPAKDDHQSDRAFEIIVDEGVKWKFIVVGHRVPKAHVVKLLVDGEAVEARRIGGNGWEMFMCSLPDGKHTVSWELEVPETQPAPFAAASHWLEGFFVREAQFVPLRLRISYQPTGLPPSELLETPLPGVERTTWIGPRVTIERTETPRQTAVSDEDLRSAKAAKLHIMVFGSQGGEYGDKWIVLNGQRIERLPVNSNAQRPDLWEESVINLSPQQIRLLRHENEVMIESEGDDCFKFTDLALAVQRPDGLWAETNHDTTVWSTPPGWLHQEGRTFRAGTPVIRLRFKAR